MSKKAGVFSCMAVAIALLIGGFWYGKMQRNATEQNQNTVVETQNPPVTQPVQSDEIASIQDLIDGEYQFQPVDTSNWQTYRNEEAGFEVKIPKDWKLSENYKQEAIQGEYFGFGESGVLYTIPEGGESGSVVSISSSDRYNPKATPLRSFIQKRKGGYNEKLYSFSLDGMSALMLGNKSIIFFDKGTAWSMNFQLYYDGNTSRSEYSVFLGMVQNFKLLR
jgi:hypothetical protein